MNSQKHLFSLPDDIHYLNCAYKAPLLKSAEEAGIKALQRGRNPIQIKVEDFFEPTHQVRKEFGKLIGAKPSSIAIIPSTSFGFSSVLNNVSGKEKGHAVTNLNEFPSGYYCLERWCKDQDQSLVVAAPTGASNSIANWNQELLEAINQDTSVVLISSVHWMNGYRFDLEAIGKRCEEVGAVFIVDGTQSVGAMPINVEECKIHALVCASYKWLFGPYSMGLMYVHEKFHDGVPLEESWMNRVNAQNFETLTQYTSDYTEGAGRYNVGETSHFVLTPILLEGLKQVNTWIPQFIQDYGEELSKPLFSYLDHLGVETNSELFSNHLFSLKLPEQIEQEQFKSRLLERKIYLSVRGDALRVSLHTFNNSNDIDQLIQAIKDSI
ncbi:MAG: aminotransferase class V-fold PLP-dependent enzyme [Schleiferiaceae bacterium]|nr:aminotransferase class V-fold PLP-dependent enzyme [Schleiferiaceae bacterium]